MTWNLWTVLLAVGCVLLVVYEVVAAIRRKPDETPTITGMVQHLSRRPAVPFFFGCLAGHLFL